MPNALQITDPDSDNPLAQAPSWADAYGNVTGSTQNPISDLQTWLAAQRAKSAQMGLWNDQTGLPTAKGLVSAAQQTGNALLMGTTAPGIRAFHGSPYDFERFDTSKIGTGEGNQAFGYGLYAAENEATAGSYKMAGPAADAQVDAINQQLTQLSKQMDQYSAGQYGKYNNPKGYELKAQYDALMDKRAALGHMYEVNISADPEQFLHWDKPLSEQHPDVQKAIGYQPRPSYEDQAALLTRLRDQGVPPEQIASHPDYKAMEARLDRSNVLENGAPVTPETPGSAIYHAFGKGDPASAAQALQQAGIPGIRYLDQGSRGAGEGTHNYVVFDANTIDILRKYGLAGLGIGLSGAAASNGSQQPPMAQ